MLLLFGSERDAGITGTARLVVVGLVLLDLLVGLWKHDEGPNIDYQLEKIDIVKKKKCKDRRLVAFI